jgi:hypothetical protein
MEMGKCREPITAHPNIHIWELIFGYMDNFDQVAGRNASRISAHTSRLCGNASTSSSLFFLYKYKRGSPRRLLAAMPPSTVQN